MKNSATTARLLVHHVNKLRVCRRCPLMHPPVVSGGAIVSKVILLGQAPRPVQLLGGALVLLGVVIVKSGERSASA